jgi:hypothetical protein
MQVRAASDGRLPAVTRALPSGAPIHRVRIGGTAWTFSHPDLLAAGPLDLMVVDEAGQFSLAATMAASIAARRL